jgi:hypothetical protein
VVVGDTVVTAVDLAELPCPRVLSHLLRERQSNPSFQLWSKLLVPAFFVGTLVLSPENSIYLVRFIFALHLLLGNTPTV